MGDGYFDQLRLSGHADRLDDLDLFAWLGVRTARYPVLWERTAPDGPESADWSWPDERLGRLRELGIRPIAGLVHHGSGPRDTSLVDPAFPEKLAAYARAVAERYPWVEDWTPVNEPLTTARFSGLYGHWYPHGRDDETFARCLLTQCRATVLAMRAIREVNPHARLVQTEDLGKTWSTPALAYQAEFENERRFLSFDLLCGELAPHKLLRHWLLRDAGVSVDELEWFVDNPCPPDVLGVNHYLSSERFLDERLERYPEESHGGNGRHEYADVLASRVLAEAPAGPLALLRETWSRYGRPLAITEAHNGCTREEQLRWLDEVWQAALAARDEGADVRAVTIWTMLGAYGWDELVTSNDGKYEPGTFDLRSPRPRPTAIAQMARALAHDGRYDHPVLESPGWWRRPERLWYAEKAPEPVARNGAQPLAIVGARGTLGRAFARLCESRGLAFQLLTRQELDIADPASVSKALDELRPWAVVNAAGFVRVDDAEASCAACARENTQGPATLAAACASRDTALLTFSSDLVFDGGKRFPYVESDEVAPLNAYGRTKVDGERLTLLAMPEALVVRTSAFFGPWDEYNFVTLALLALEAGDVFAAADDLVISPTYVPDLVHATLDLLIDGEHGIWHVANEGEVSWAELATAAAELAGADASLIEPVPSELLDFVAPRPPYSVLGSERGQLLPSLENALERYVEALALGRAGERERTTHVG